MSEIEEIAEYIKQLTVENEWLKAELTKRPVVYVKVTRGKRRMSPGGWPMLYTQEEVDIYLGQSQFEPYTGEQK